MISHAFEFTFVFLSGKTRHIFAYNYFVKSNFSFRNFYV